MPKRLTDTDKWKKQFIKNLPAAYKLLWFYITDDCNHAGIWHVEIDIASKRIGEPITEKRAKQLFKNHILIIDNGEKWFIPDFIDFQYGTLNPANKVHNSVINLLRKYTLIDKYYKAHARGLEGSKDKDKKKGKEKDKGK